MHVAIPRRRFRASRISAPARRLVDVIASGGEARVHSIFRSALNVDVAGTLLTLSPESAGGLPSSILLDDGTPLPDLSRLGIGARARVAVAGEALVIPSASFTVELAAADTWSPRLRPRDGSAWAARSELVAALARARRVAGGIASLPVARGPIAGLEAAIAVGDRSAAVRAARPIIGLGPGLTPSGDDLLAGIEAALHALDHPLAGFLDGVLDDVDARTTRVSATLLRHATNGEFGERLAACVAALLSGPIDALPAAIERCCAWGATSGSDTLVGILVGLDAAALAGTRAA